jgi:hypothetical protein
MACENSSFFSDGTFAVVEESFSVHDWDSYEDQGENRVRCCFVGLVDSGKRTYQPSHSAFPSTTLPT